MVTAIERPRCPRCFIRMSLLSAESRKGGFEKQIFGCGKCPYVETKMVPDPLKSSTSERLAQNVRPPV
jgi:hypothetical protein